MRVSDETKEKSTLLGEDSVSSMWKWNFIVAGLVMAMGVAVCVAALHLPPPDEGGDPGAGFWPLMLGGGLCLLALVLAVANMLGAANARAKTFALVTPANRRVYAFMGLTAFYCLLMYVLGFVIAALVFVPCSMYLMEFRNPRNMLLTSVILVGSIYILFGVLLKTPLPEPIFWR